MGSYVRATRSAFKQQWREQFTIGGTLAPLLSSLALAISVGWLVGRSQNDVALSYVFVGAPLMGLWQMGVFRTGWALENERFQGTLDLMLTTRTPVAAVVFAKTLAIMASQAITAGVTLLVLFAFAGRFISVESAPLLFVSGLLAIGGVVVVSFVFAPLIFLVGGRGGFFNAIIPAGTVLSGFLYPTGLLPAGLEEVARILPTAWAMEAVVRSTVGGDTTDIVLGWLAAALLIGAFASLAALLFRKAESRVRVTGSLAVM